MEVETHTSPRASSFIPRVQEMEGLADSISVLNYLGKNFKKIYFFLSAVPWPSEWGGGGLGRACQLQ